MESETGMTEIKTVSTADVVTASDAGWRYDDGVMLTKLTASVREFGQLRLPVVRTGGDGRLHVIRGRNIVTAVRLAGLEDITVLDVGKRSESDAIAIALALEIGREINYANLGHRVAVLVRDGRSAQEVSGLSPFSTERIESFVTLSTFDWSEYDKTDDGQSGFSFGDDQVFQPEPEEEEIVHVGSLTFIGEPAEVEPESVPSTTSTESTSAPLPVLPGQASLF